MAKKKKGLSPFVSYLILFIFLLLLFMVYMHGQKNRYLTGEHFPKTAQNLNIHDKGIDVSVWQKNVDFEKVKKQGFNFVIIRASYGWSKDNVDKRFLEHLKKAKEAGLKVGAYHYSYATNVDEAKKEAELFISMLKNHHFDYPVYFDMEDDCQLHLSNKTRTDIALSFLKTVSEAGYDVGLYANQHWLETKLDMEQLEDYEIWMASYTSFNKYKGKYEMWQYTSEGQIEGIEGPVDLNLVYKDY